ncbi:hypothetical protein VCHA51O444_10387 [Vibrio chagasii]|nr:hypothetical protein VCHA51O444_10387 [Vibrio chagasii]
MPIKEKKCPNKGTNCLNGSKANLTAKFDCYKTMLVVFYELMIELEL